MQRKTTIWISRDSRQYHGCPWTAVGSYEIGRKEPKLVRQPTNGLRPARKCWIVKGETISVCEGEFAKLFPGVRVDGGKKVKLEITYERNTGK